jgi:hypothetical protein
VTDVVRLETVLDLDDDGADPYRMSVSARHEAVLSDGGRVFVSDRGWTSWLHGAGSETTDIWPVATVADIEATARMVVGPDEPAEGCPREVAEAGHWAWITDVLHRGGVDIDSSTLRHLPHEVRLSERLLARLGRDSDDD